MLLVYILCFRALATMLPRPNNCTFWKAAERLLDVFLGAKQKVIDVRGLGLPSGFAALIEYLSGRTFTGCTQLQDVSLGAVSLEGLRWPCVPRSGRPAFDEANVVIAINTKLLYIA